jgi:hypothetical protein
MDELLTVRGVGPKLAEKLIRDGHTNPKTLFSLDFLPDAVRWYSKYYDALEQRIPHDIVGEIIEAFVSWDRVAVDLGKKGSRVGLGPGGHIVGLGPGGHIVPVGSYRRKSKDSGDVDVLLISDTIDGESFGWKKPTPYGEKMGVVLSSTPKMILSLIAVLEAGKTKISFIVDVKLDGEKIFHPVVIEVYCCPIKEVGSALLQYTGDYTFNIVMRKKAKDLGLKLSQHGLYRGKKRVASSSEEEIFSMLGIPWIEPELRGTEESLHAIHHGKFPVGS